MEQQNLLSDIYENVQYTFICDDTIHFLKTLENESVQLVITSPPYNIGKSYEKRKSIQEYLNTQKNVIIELVRILKYA